MVYTQMYLMFCRSSLNRLLVCLIHLIFTVGNCILKTNNSNVSFVTIAIFSTFFEYDSFISYCNAYFFILYYTTILKEIIWFVN